MRYVLTLFSTIVAVSFFTIPAVASDRYSEEAYLPETQRHVTFVKQVGSEKLLAIDESGKVVDADVLIQAETAAQEKKYGKLEPALWQMLQSGPKSEVFLVHIYLYSSSELEEAIEAKRDIEGRKGAMEKAEFQYALEAAEAGRLLIVEDMIAPVSESVSNLGGTIEHEFTSTHSLTAWMTKGAIEALQNRPDVMRIYGNDQVFEPDQDNAWRTLGSAYVWAKPITGKGAKIAIVEGDSVRTDRPYIHNLAAVRQSCPGDHATRVAHCATSDQNHWRGIAPFATIYSANDCSWTSSGLQAAMQWAKGYDCDVYNHSYGLDTGGAPDSHDQYLDQFAYDNDDLQVKSAGNNASYITSPGHGYNTLTVGGIDDKNTIAHGTDTMYVWSNYLDGTGARTKPEVVAPAVDLQWYVWGPPRTGPPALLESGSGTSYAAPQVAGMAALIESSGWPCGSGLPETQKAAILATAYFNVVSGTDKDGVGSVYAGQLGQVFDLSRAHCYAASRNADFTLTFDLQRAKQGSGNPRMRAVIAWLENPSGIHRSGKPYPNFPQNDWDLTVRRPDNSSAGLSSTTRRTFEWVDFTIDQSGTWSFFINNWGDSGISSYIALVLVHIP